MNTHLVTPRSWSFLRPVGAACWDVNDGVDGELGGRQVCFPEASILLPILPSSVSQISRVAPTVPAVRLGGPLCP